MDEKKRRTGQSVAFYAALAVCLTAVGVGAWQLLQPEKGGEAASGPAAAMGPEAAEAEAASGLAELPDVDAPSVEVADAESAPESGAAQAVSGSDAPESKDAGSGGSSNGGSSNGGSSKDAGSGNSKDAGSGGSSKGSANAGSGASSKGSGKGSNGDSSKGSGKGSNGDSSKGSGASSKDSADKGKPSGEVMRPVEGAVITGYSMDKLLYNETMRDWRTHDGIDIAADAGTAVVAARAGTVESVTADPIMGTTVTIRHEGQWESAYSSLTDAPEVEAGDEVKAGQVIGFVGESAASESALGPHLHFAAFNGGAPSDPEAFLS